MTMVRRLVSFSYLFERLDAARVLLTRVCLTTWVLWLPLLHPPSHPLFYRTLKLLDARRITTHLTWIVLLPGWLICGIVWTQLAPLHLPIVVFFMAMMLISSSSYVSTWIIRIVSTIISAQEKHTYDQLCLPPSGALGANWAICAACLHHNDTLGWIDFFRKLIAALLLFVLLMALMNTTLVVRTLNPIKFIWIFLDIIALAFVAYTDHAQSTVLGGLTAMLVTRFSRNKTDTLLVALVIFWLVQGIALLAALFTALVLLPNWQIEISPVLVGLTLFYAIREGFIAILWRELAHHLNADRAFNP